MEENEDFAEKVRVMCKVRSEHHDELNDSYIYSVTSAMGYIASRAAEAWDGKGGEAKALAIYKREAKAFGEESLKKMRNDLFNRD